MNNYVNNNLSKDEKVKQRAKINKLAIIAPLFSMVFLIIVGIVLSLLINKLNSSLEEPSNETNGYFTPEEEPMLNSIKIMFKILPWFIIVPIATIPLIQILRIL